MSIERTIRELLGRAWAVWHRRWTRREPAHTKVHHSVRRLTFQMLPIALAVVWALQTHRLAFATAGVAEWEITTPGGNRISHIDPLKERYGTCLRKADDQPGVIVDDPARIYVDHVEWWQYYPQHVLGQARQGFFIFDESLSRAEYFKSEQEFLREIEHRKLGHPVSQRRTPADGWNEAWAPAIRERCTQLAKEAPEKGISDAASEALRKYCDQVK